MDYCNLISPNSVNKSLRQRETSLFVRFLVVRELSRGLQCSPFPENFQYKSWFCVSPYLVLTEIYKTNVEYISVLFCSLENGLAARRNIF